MHGRREETPAHVRVTREKKRRERKKKEKKTLANVFILESWFDREESQRLLLSIERVKS